MAFADAFGVFPRLETARLALRQLRPEDAADYHREQAAARSVPGRPRWSFGREQASVDAARLAIERANDGWWRAEWLRWGVCRRDNGVLIGMCELSDFVHESLAELGYWLGPDHQRQGLMPEAAGAVVRYGFETMGLQRIWAVTSTSNRPSARMLERLGFRREGVLRQHTLRDGVWDDSLMLARLGGDERAGAAS